MVRFVNKLLKGKTGEKLKEKNIESKLMVKTFFFQFSFNFSPKAQYLSENIYLLL